MDEPPYFWLGADAELEWIVYNAKKRLEEKLVERDSNK